MGDKPRLLPYLCHLDEYRPAPHGKRPAYFSTSYGRWRARSKFENMPTQIRSDYVEAREEMVQSLRSQYPEACKALNTEDVAPNDSPLTYFDEFDLTFYQPQFLYEVLALIVHGNHEEERARESEVTAFAESWIKINEDAYHVFDACHQPKDLFLVEEFEEYGSAFLEACFWRIAQIKEKAETSQTLHPSSRIGHTSHSTDLGGSQHTNGIPRPHSVQSSMPPHQHEQPAESRSPSHVPILPISTSTNHSQHVQQPASLPAARVQQPASRPNAEPKQFGRELYVPHIVPRQVPVIYTAESPRQSRHYTPVGRDMPRTTNPGGSVEHFKATRKDYHSDPAPTAWSPQVGMTENFIAKYAEGKAGPFAYQRVPTSARERGFPAHSSQIDRGIRNPYKKTSDDARAAVESTTNRQWVPYLSRPLTEDRPPKEYAPLVDRRPSRTSSFGPGGYQLDHLNRDRANVRDAEQRRRNAFPGVLSGAMELITPLKPRFVSNPFETNQVVPPMRYPHPALDSNGCGPARPLYDPVARIPPPRDAHDPRFENSQPPLHPPWAGNDRKPLAQMPNSGPRHAGAARELACKVWLGGLPAWVSPIDLKQFFEGYQGFVEISTVREKEDFRFGWATFRDRESRDFALKTRDEFKKRFGEQAKLEPALASRPYIHRQHQMQKSDTLKKGQENSGPTHNDKPPMEPKAKQSPTKEQHRSNKLGDGADDGRKESVAKDPKESPEPGRKIKPVQTPLQENKAGLNSAESKQPAARKPSGQHGKKQSAGGKPSVKTGSSAKEESPSVPENNVVPTSEDFPPLLSPKNAPSVTKPALDVKSENGEKKLNDSLSQDSQRAQINDTKKQGEYPIDSNSVRVLPESDAKFPHKQGSNADSFAQVTARQVKGSDNQESEPAAPKAIESEIGAAEVEMSEAKTPEIQSPTKAPEVKFSEAESLAVQVSEGKPALPNKQDEDWKTAQPWRNLKRLRISTDKQSSVLPDSRESSSSPMKEESTPQPPNETKPTQKPDAEAIGADATKPSKATQKENFSSVGPSPISSPTSHPPTGKFAFLSPPSQDNVFEDQKPVPTSASLEEEREQDIVHSRARSESSSAAKHQENQTTLQNKPEDPSSTRGDEAAIKRADHDGVVENDLTPHSHDIPHKTGEATQEERPAGSHIKDNEVTLPMEPISTHKKKRSKPSTPTRRNISESGKTGKSQEQSTKQASPPKTPESTKVEYPKATSNLVTELKLPMPQAPHSGKRSEQHSSSTSIEKPGRKDEPPTVDSCGGEYRLIAGLPTPSMGQRLAELPDSVWQDIRKDSPAIEHRSSKDKMREQQITPSSDVSNSHVETASAGEELPDSKLYSLQDRFFTVQTVLKCVMKEFRKQRQVTVKAANLLSSSSPGLDQGISNLYAWMVSWVYEAESLIKSLPQSTVYGQALRQELRCSLPNIKQALNDLSQEYFATQESQADFGNFTLRLHKVGREAEDLLKMPIPMEHGNKLVSFSDMNTQLAWHATALRLMDLWKSGRDGYKNIVQKKITASLMKRGLDAAEELFTEAIANLIWRPALGAGNRPQNPGELPRVLAEKRANLRRRWAAKGGQGAAVDDTTGATGHTTGGTEHTTGATGHTTGATGHTTEEGSQEDKPGDNSKAKSKKKSKKKKKKSKAKNAATTGDSAEPAAESARTGKDSEGGLLTSEYLSKEQKKDGLEEYEWVFEATKREFAKHDFDQPGSLPSIYDFIPKDGPWGAIDLDVAKAQIKSRVLEQNEKLLDDTQNKRLAEHADMEEAASALANMKFTPTSSQGSNATIPDSETIAADNNNATKQNDLKENIATINEKGKAITEDHASTKEENMTLKEDIATTEKTNTAAEEMEENGKSDSMNKKETNIVIKENNTHLRGGDAQAAVPAVNKKPANGKGSDSWSVPTGEPVWGGSGSGAGHNGNKRKTSGGQKRKLGK